METVNCKEEIIDFVMNSSDADNLIIAAFITGMQARKSFPSYENQREQSPTSRRKGSCEPGHKNNAVTES